MAQFLTPTGTFDRAEMMREAWRRLRRGAQNHLRRRFGMHLAMIWAQAKQERSEMGLSDGQLHARRLAAELAHVDFVDSIPEQRRERARLSALLSAEQTWTQTNPSN